MVTSPESTISVVIPVRNGGDRFRLCLSSLADADPPPREVIVVADGNSDGSWRVAQEFGLKVLRLPAASGPGRARNAGALQATGDVLLFVDADVTIRRDTISRIAAAFRDHPEIAALFGSYDDAPAEPNFLSQYKNLMHHHVHRTAKSEASTFWAGCGAVRRNVFLEMGGFDSGYRHPMIEDIEFGYRLRKAGYRILLLKDLQVKHLKRWNAGSLLKADVFYRALPWTHLILNGGGMVDDLNLRASNRLSVLVIFGLSLSLAMAPWVPGAILPALLLMTILVWLNRDLYRFLMKKRGLRFLLQAIPWQLFYFLYSGLAFATGYLIHLFTRKGTTG
jgi:glycosyltransferase involved in cell wall biosynthesis